MEYPLHSPKSKKSKVSMNALIFVLYGSMSILLGSVIVAVFFEGTPTVQLKALRPQYFRTYLNLCINAGAV
jgi:hypothetical protein